MIKRYSFTTEEKAKELITTLELEEGQTTSDLIEGIVIWGFEDKYEYNEETEEQILISKGETFDVDIYWKLEIPTIWDEFEINPKTPSHI